MSSVVAYFIILLSSYSSRSRISCLMYERMHFRLKVKIFISRDTYKYNNLAKQATFTRLRPSNN